MNPIEHSLESQFNKASTDKWLVDRFNSGDYRGLLEAALILNTLHQLERDMSAPTMDSAENSMSE